MWPLLKLQSLSPARLVARIGYVDRFSHIANTRCPESTYSFPTRDVVCTQALSNLLVRSSAIKFLIQLEIFSCLAGVFLWAQNKIVG